MWTKAGQLNNKNLMEYVQDLKPELKQLTIIPTELCNYRCKMCYMWGEKGESINKPQEVLDQQLDIGAIKDFIESILQVNKRFKVVMTGGEPMLYKHFKELLEFLRTKKIPVLLMTNGSLLEGNIQCVLENTTSVYISLDGSEEVHDGIRGKNSYNTVCRNIERLLDEKKKSKRVFPFININMVISKYNYKNAKAFVEALRERFGENEIALESSKGSLIKPGGLAVGFEPVLFTTCEKGERYAREMKEYLDCEVSSSWKGFVGDAADISPELIKSEIEGIWNSEGLDYSSFVDLKEYFQDIDNVFGRTRCLAPWYELTVRNDGFAYPCVDFPDYALGNIASESFKDIWEGNKALKFRSLLKERSLSVCNRCRYLYNNYW